MIEPFAKVDTLQFETSTNCNARCTFCPHQQMTRKGSMPLRQIIDLLYYLAPYAKTHICPFGMQEPLLESRLTQVLTNCKLFNYRAETTIYSNMSVLPREKLKNIMKWGVLDNVVISFYGTSKEVYEKLQPPLNYEQTVSNIKKFMRLRNRLRWWKPFVTLRLLLTRETVPLANKFRKRWKPIVDRVGFTYYDSVGGKMPYDVEWETRLWGSPKPRVPCIRLYETMNIHFNGNVVLCCNDTDDQIVLGNIWKDGWDVWWTSPKLKRIRQLHEQKRWDEISLCKDCAAWRYNHPDSWVKFWQDQKLKPVLSASNQ